MTGLQMTRLRSITRLIFDNNVAVAVKKTGLVPLRVNVPACQIWQIISDLIQKRVLLAEIVSG